MLTVAMTYIAMSLLYGFQTHDYQSFKTAASFINDNSCQALMELRHCITHTNKVISFTLQALEIKERNLHNCLVN